MSGGIVRVEHDKERPYVMVAKALTEDRRASFGLRGMLVYLLGKPPGWSAQMGEIEAASSTPGKDGREAIRSYFKEGRELGYIKTVEQREKGRVSYVHTVYERPLAAPVPLIVTVDGLPSAVSRQRSTVNGQPSTATRSLISNEGVNNQRVNNKTPLTPQGGEQEAAETPAGQEAGGSNPQGSASPVTSDNGQGNGTEQSAGAGKGSAGAGRRKSAPKPELPADDLRGLVEVYNAHADVLPKVQELNPGRVKSLCRLWQECGYDLQKTRELIADATREVAADDFWIKSRKYGFDNLLPKVWQRAEAWRNRQANPAPLEVAGARPPRRDMTQAQAVAAASQNAAAMLDFLED